jgi:tRNA N6-adenosine threonylcarbamoyltransferase
MIVLGIESSCDETAAALVRDDRTILADLVLSQIEEHRPFGGIVPEIAARSHLDHLAPLIGRALDAAGLDLGQIDAVAATGGPGLIGGLIVGLTMGKALAASRGLPFLSINHLEGHALSARLAGDIDFPYLLLLVSGGHCQLLMVEGVGRYRRLGTTIDDAAGEAFDKAAKLLGLGYPGGPALERAAALGDPRRFLLPRPMKGRPGCDFSFSGLKTALRQRLADLGPSGPSVQDVADLAAGFQAAVSEAISDRVAHALDAAAQMSVKPNALVAAGGVAANALLRRALEALADGRGVRFIAPPLKLCTDNGAMIAWAGIERFRLGLVDALDAAPRPRWPLDPTAAPAPFAGVKA